MKYKLVKLSITKYLVISCIAGVIDLVIAYFLYNILGFNYLAACNAGIIAGFIFQYLTCTKYIFKQAKILNSFIVYIITFFIGFAMADIIMFISFNKFKFHFVISKTLSMILPFFAIYLIRKSILGLKVNKSGDKM